MIYILENRRIMARGVPITLVVSGQSIQIEDNYSPTPTPKKREREEEKEVEFRTQISPANYMCTWVGGCVCVWVRAWA
jgi:hypothetical protein